MIFVMSSNSVNSIWCKYELNYFTELRKPIYCIDIDIDMIEKQNFSLDNIDDSWFLDPNYKTMALIHGKSINV